MAFERATRRASTGAAVLVAVLACVSVASAASAESRAAARQHLKQAEQLKKSGQLTEACKHLEEVERLDPKLPTLMELAECTEQLGKVVEAQAWWSLARDRAKRDEKPQSRARAESRLAAVQKRVAYLTLQLAAGVPAAAQVLCDDVVLEPNALTGPLPLNPGDHVIVVKLAGHDDAKYPVKLADGDKKTLPVAAGPRSGSAAPQSPAAPAASPLPPPSPAAPLPPPTQAVPATQPVAQPATSWWSGERKAGVVFGAVGVAALGGGSALYFASNRDAEGSLVDSRVSLSAISVLGGGVLLLSGVVLLAGASSEQAPQAAGLTLSPTLLVAQRAAVLGAAGAF